MLEYPYMEVPASNGFQPVVPVMLSGPKGRLIVDMLVDTGANDIVLPKRLAERLGISLSAESQGESRTLSGDSLGRFPAVVQLELRQSGFIVRWAATVAFVDNAARNLFGRTSGLEYFHAHFLGPERVLRLDPQSSLPRSAAEAVTVTKE